MKLPLPLIIAVSASMAFVAGWAGSTLVGSNEKARAQAEIRDLRERLAKLDNPATRSPRSSANATASAPFHEQGSPTVGFAVGGSPAVSTNQDSATASQSTSASQNDEEQRRAAQREREREFRQAAVQTARNFASARVESLRLALNLRPDQIARLNNVLQSLSTEGENFSWREMRDFNERLERALEGTLTPEQISALNNYRERETRARTEARTNIEFSMLDVALSLQPQQSDAVFNTLARINALENDPAFLARVGNQDRDAVRNALREEKRAAMSQLLSPEQMRLYNQILETQDFMGRRFRREARQ